MDVLSSKKNSLVYLTDQQDESYLKVDTFHDSLRDISSLAAYQAIFIRNNKNLFENIRRIKQHHDPEVYLKPLFVKTEHRTELSRYILQVIDGIVTDDNLYKHFISNRNLVETINQKLTNLLSFDQKHKDVEIPLKLIRYLFTRQTRLNPVMTASSVYGYVYPDIDILFFEDNFQQFMILDFLESKHILHGEFLDRIHFCNYCYSGFLNFREICISCGSPDIKNEDLMHHFVCGYVGPESDYKQGNELFCPKCRKLIKHIGVDYDRPSVIYECNQCKQTFQEPDVDVICIKCEKKSKPEKLILRSIKEYELTPSGENSAIFGMIISLQEALDLDILDLETFKIFLNFEIQRIIRYQLSNSSVGMLNINDFINVFSSFGSKAKDISKEISEEISNAIRTTDLLAPLSDSSLIFLFTETASDHAKIAIERLKIRILELIRTNFGIEPEIRTHYLTIDGKLSHEELIQQMVEYDRSDL